MKNNWQTKKLSEICEVIAGQSPEGQFYNNLGKGLPFYQGKKEFTDKFIGTPTTWTTKITKVAQKDDILMSVRAPVGPVNFSTERICIGRGLAAIRVTEQIDKDFLFYFLQIFENEIESNTGAVFDSINKNQIENIKLLLPSISEQKRIVALLDEIFEKIEKAKENIEKNLQNSRELFESLTNKIINETNSNYINLGDLIEVLTDFVANGSFASLRQNVKYLKNEGYAILVRLTDLRKKLETNNGVFVSESSYKYLKKSSLHGGEYLIANVGANIGDVYQMPKINRPATLGPNMFLVKFKKEINSDYVLAISKYYIKPIIVKASQGAAQPKINKSQFRNIKVPYPSISKQKSVVKKLDELSEQTKKLEENHKEKLADLEELKKSVLQKAFAGEL
ncbi:MAG TPA: restriction endonuclease subunit S, partial [Hanamia sp.]|nr:restriction endonuclease subunit S [Hanamia sp.]